jgi:hypothetical protein
MKVRMRAAVPAIVGVLLMAQTAWAGDSFSEKVEAFRAELGGYHAGLQPEERSAAGKRINAALLDILREEESLAADPGGILGDEGRFALIFGDWASAGDRRYRVVTLRPSETGAGEVAAVFAQSRRGDRAGKAEIVYALAPGADGEIVYAAMAGAGNGLLLAIAEKHDGPGSKYVSVNTRKLEKGKWLEYFNPPQVKAKGEWTVRTGDGSFSVSHASVGRDAGNDLEVRVCRGYIEILAVDSGDMPFDNTRLRLMAGVWVVE